MKETQKPAVPQELAAQIREAAREIDELEMRITELERQAAELRHAWTSAKTVVACLLDELDEKAPVK